MDSFIKLKVVLQRTKNAEVTINHQSQGKFNLGFMIFLGVGLEKISKEEKDKIYSLDSKDISQMLFGRLSKLADKILNLRVFPDDSGKMNLNISDVDGGIYIVSQFTLFADCAKGNRPSFSHSLSPEIAKDIYELFINIMIEKGKKIIVYRGEFGADMQVQLCNDGPVTLILEY
jgi:D-tyrosyl-tRNA(Tyr) deacylase